MSFCSNISLSFTPPRYSQYTVTLAYHVIAAWFVRSRVAYRKGFVGFVSKVKESLDPGAQSNMSVYSKLETLRSRVD